MNQFINSFIFFLSAMVKQTFFPESQAYNQEKIELIISTLAINLAFLLIICLTTWFFYKKSKKKFILVVVILTFIDLYFFSSGNLISIPFSAIKPSNKIHSWLSDNLDHQRFLSTSGNLPYTGLGVYWTHLRAREPFSPNQLTGEELKNFTRLKLEIQALPENQGILSRLHDTSGYAAAVPESYIKFWGDNNSSPNAINISSTDDAKLDLMGTKYLVSGYPDDYIKEDTSGKFKKAFGDEKIIIYENLNAYPRAFLSDGQKSDKSEIIEYQPTFIKIMSESPIKTNLILTDSYYPGWMAYLDGNLVKMEIFSQVFRQVEIPPGKHIITFKFQPNSIKLGAIISTVTLIFIASHLLWIRRKSQ